MGRPVANNGSTYKIDMSHQEVERLLEELEEVLKHTPAEWVSAEAAANWLCHDQGYEDMAEFEDALHGTFEQFISVMPHLETSKDDKGRLVLRLKPEIPQDKWTPKRMTIRITDRSQLWNVCVKSPHATVEIPELEFEISSDGKRKIDSIYNILASAIFNLGTHVRQGASGISHDHQIKIMECVDQLNKLLDVDHPWTWVVHDPSGMSEIGDMTNVEVEYIDREEAPQQQEAPAAVPAGDAEQID